MGGHSQALEEQVRLVQWMRGTGTCLPHVRAEVNASRGDASPAMRAFAPVFNRIVLSTLETAEAFYWSPEMCDVLRTVAHTMPTWTLRKQDLLVERGFMHFATPLTLPGRENEDWAVPLSGLAWRPADEHDPPEWDRDAVYVTPFVSFSGRALPFLPFPFTDGEDVMAFFNQGIGMPRDFPDRPMVEQAMSYVGASIALVRQQIISIPQERAERGTRKRLPDDWGHEPLIRVVQLRRVSARGGAGSADVAWSYRWVVSGHWRQQVCGPGRSERRPTYVLPYLKGPESKPLKVDAGRVFEVVR